VQTLVFVTVYTGMGLNGDIAKGIYDRFRSMPIWQPAPIVGALLGDVLRYSLAAAVVFIVGFLLGFRPEAGFLGVIAAVGLTIVFCFSLSWIWIIIGMKVQSPESVMTTSFLFLFPLTMVSDIFVDPATMPDWLQTVVSVNPVTFLARASRGLMNGGVELSDIGWVLLAAAVITAVFAPIAMRLYRSER